MESEEKGPEAMSNIICRTESDSLNTQQWYKRNKAEEDMATKAVILVGGPGKVIFQGQIGWSNFLKMHQKSDFHAMSSVNS